MAHILIIDDMDGVRHALSAALKRAGHSVAEAGNGETGLKLASESVFDVILTDIVMPGIDGTEVIMAVNAMPIRPVIIAMSGGGAHVTSEEALILAKQTADGALTKPFKSSELLDLIDALLRKGGAAKI